jgi:glycosyltransferase involved in cell wall biosynthesis
MSSLKRIPITAIVPIKNGQIYFSSIKSELIKTLTAQDQIIVIDDNSSDSTYEIYKQWSNTDSRVQVLKNKKPGLSNALNLGISHAQNEWIARFDQDDLYHPDRIKIQLSKITDSTVAVFSDYKFRSKSGVYLGFQSSAIYPACVSVSLNSNRRTPHPVALLNKSAVQSVGGYLQDHFPAEDLSLWLRLSKIGELKSVPDQLLSYTLNKSGVTQYYKNSQNKMKNKLWSEIGILKSDLQHVEDNLFNITEDYRSLNHSNLRSIMLVNDYISLCKRQNIKINYSEIQKIFLSISSPSYFIAYTDFLFWGAARKLYRLS